MCTQRVDAAREKTVIQATSPDAADWIAIMQLVSRYIHIVDDGAWDRLGEVFIPDAVCDYRAFGLSRLEGVEQLQHAFERMGELGQHPLAHHAVNTLIEAGANADERRARSKMLLLMPDGRVWSGEYRDRVVRTEGRWLFAERISVQPRSRQSAG